MGTYKSGYLILTQNSATVEGLGTRFQNYVHAGDILHVGSFTSTILSVESHHRLTLADMWADVSAHRINYEIETFPVPITADDRRKEFNEQIDSLAGQARHKYSSFFEGQDVTYTDKLLDARSYITAGYPNLTDGAAYPWVWEESFYTGDTPAQVADAIMATATQWRAIGAKIEGARKAARKLIALPNATEASMMEALTQFRQRMLDLPPP